MLANMSNPYFLQTPVPHRIHPGQRQMRDARPDSPPPILRYQYCSAPSPLATEYSYCLVAVNRRLYHCKSSP
ncbi:hypothetical protein BDV59DRAFT_183312 [Aspergillus ambiguus]|uniref:uncharacterized protein n=1 Tax=Aspergillus ambiguus TaxID=176160 RepID=UPI003CCC9671